MANDMPSAQPPETGVEIAVYDLDRTLTDSGSWVPFIVHWLRREAPARLVFVPLVALAGMAHGLGLVSRGRLKEIAHRWLIGPRVAADRLDGVAQDFAGRFLAAHALAPARAALAADAAAGRRLLIASASHGYYVRALAAGLGVANVVATEARRAGGVVLNRLDGPNCYGAAKRAAVEAWLRAQGLAGAVVHFTSDHHSDLPCFELALASGGTVRCANPSPRLAAMAVARGWPVVRWGRIRASLLERA